MLPDQRHLFLMCRVNPATEVFAGRCGASRRLCDQAAFLFIGNKPTGRVRLSSFVTCGKVFPKSLVFVLRLSVFSDLTRTVVELGESRTTKLFAV